VLSCPSSLLRPPPTPSRLPSPSLASVIGRRAARTADPRPRRASPVPRTTFWPFHALYAGRFLGTRSRIPGAVHGLRPSETGSAPPCSAIRRTGITTLVRLHSRCGPASCHRLHAVSSFRFDAGISPDAGNQLPGTLASPRTGLAPAGCPQLVARLRHRDLLVVVAPELLDAPLNCRHRSGGLWLRGNHTRHRSTIALSGFGVSLSRRIRTADRRKHAA